MAHMDVPLMRFCRGLEPQLRKLQVFDKQSTCDSDVGPCTQIDSQGLVIDDPKLASLVRDWARLLKHVRQSIGVLSKGWIK